MKRKAPERKEKRPAKRQKIDHKTEQKIEYKNELPKSRNGCFLSYGQAQMSQLGQSCMERDVETVKFPKPVPLLQNMDVIEYKCGAMHTAVLVKNKNKKTSIYTWGTNDKKVLGRPTKDEVDDEIPKPIPFFEGKKITKISVGDYHMCALDRKGVLYAWGTFKDDAFIGLYPGLGDDLIDEPEEYDIEGIRDEFMVSVESGPNFFVATNLKGDLIEVGPMSERSLAINTRTKNKRGLVGKKVFLPKGKKAAQVECGNSHAIVLCTDGKVVAWGYDHQNQLGLGERKVKIAANDENEIKSAGKPVDIPKEVDIRGKVKQIAAGGYHNLVLTEKNRIYVWGENKCGQLGLGNQVSQPKPVRLEFFDKLPDGDKPKFIAAGLSHSMVTTEQGNLYTFGQSLFPEDEDVQTSPVQVKRGLDNWKVLQTKGGANFNVLLAQKKEPKKDDKKDESKKEEKKEPKKEDKKDESKKEDNKKEDSKKEESKKEESKKEESKKDESKEKNESKEK